MSKLLVICGPTATGKTSLGLELAKKFKGDILSADSRQVFQQMNIITGKDVPKNSKWQMLNAKWDGRKIGYWQTPEGVRIWLLDLVDPTEEFSVAHWNRVVWTVLAKLWKKGKLPILVGGTGLYIKSVVDGIETIEVPPNKSLRARLSTKSPEELYDILAQLDSVRAAQMNRSDRKNPRRLMRAIEVASWKIEGGLRPSPRLGEPQGSERGPQGPAGKMDVLMIGLTAPREVLYRRIDGRVEERLKKGAVEEVKKLLKAGVSWDAQSMMALGYRQLRGYFEDNLRLEKVREAWKNAEHKYARQQLTWFKRDKRIRWFDIDKEGWRSQVEKLVQRWYN